MIVRCQFWSQRVRFGTIEHIGDRLAFLRSEGGDVDEGFTFSFRVAAITAPA
jgi:hypothetical protein